MLRNFLKNLRVMRATLAALALMACLTLASPPRARADDDECQRRVARADHKLHEAAEHHGWESKQAEHARHELREAREHCWATYHKWWDEDGHRWHTDRDWDDHDHDHDHGH